MNFTWRALSSDDLPLLAAWLARPHVHRYWFHDPAEVEKDFGPSVRGEEPGEDLLVSLDGHPFGLLQRSSFDDYPDMRAEVGAIVEVPAGAVTVDYFVADAERCGHGLGSAMILTLVQDLWQTYPDAPCVIVSVVASNTASWRALERIGFRRVGEGDLEPDNPIDAPLHYVYRLDRPVDNPAAR